MSRISRYWQLVRLKLAGGITIDPIPQAKEFFHASFGAELDRDDVPDLVFQRQLLEFDRRDRLSVAHFCLRCFISHQIYQTCRDLVNRFGRERGLTEGELLALVLDDTLDRVMGDRSGYQPLASKILQTFDPSRSSLATWTIELVKSHSELNRLLLEYGIYIITDWAILNDTTVKQVERIFSEFYQRTSQEIEAAAHLLETYHAIYRAQRIQQRKTGGSRQCLPPTETQLAQMSECLQQRFDRSLSKHEVMHKLQQMAALLRQHRIYRRGGAPEIQSLSNPDTCKEVEQQELVHFAAHRDDDRSSENEFLRDYRRSLIVCLDRALGEVLQAYMNRKTRQNFFDSQSFLLGLSLFYCQKKSMNEIAEILGLKAQYQVTRLLKLKSFRSDIQQKLISSLREIVLEKASVYTNPEALSKLESEIEEAIYLSIENLLENERDSRSPNSSGEQSLFTQGLCSKLKQLGC
jgi:hypothetical protein